MGAADRDISLADDLGTTAYRVIAPIARGSMGEVYEVEHRELGARRVMKVIRAYLQEAPDAIDRLRTEARLLTRLERALPRLPRPT